jgi:hypothetical protein
VERGGKICEISDVIVPPLHPRPLSLPPTPCAPAPARVAGEAEPRDWYQAFPFPYIRSRSGCCLQHDAAPRHAETLGASKEPERPHGGALNSLGWHSVRGGGRLRVQGEGMVWGCATDSCTLLLLHKRHNSNLISLQSGGIICAAMSPSPCLSGFSRDRLASSRWNAKNIRFGSCCSRPRTVFWVLATNPAFGLVIRPPVPVGTCSRIIVIQARNAR